VTPSSPHTGTHIRAKQPNGVEPPPGLCHAGDHSGSIRVRPGEQVRVLAVDFAVLSDASGDIAQSIEHAEDLLSSLSTQVARLEQCLKPVDRPVKGVPSR
jgi:hypothetical protein